MRFYPDGVQGVASSNPAAPTKRINESGQSSDWPFSFMGGVLAFLRGWVCSERFITPSVLLIKKRTRGSFINGWH